MNHQVDRWGEARDFGSFPATARRRRFLLVGYVLFTVAALVVFSAVRATYDAVSNRWPSWGDFRHAKVTGRVTHKGRPLKSGSILFKGSDGKSVEASIYPNGHYLVPSTAVGPTVVSFFDHPMAQLLCAKSFSNSEEDLALAHEKGTSVLSANVVAGGLSCNGTSAFNAAALSLLRDEWCFGVPNKYYWGRSSLKIMIKAGMNDIDIDLTD